jgi:hypothetical protein
MNLLNHVRSARIVSTSAIIDTQDVSKQIAITTPAIGM